MEAGAADCLYQGALAGDGSPRIVGEIFKPLRLVCTESLLLWLGYSPQPRNGLYFVSDWVSAKGMRMLAAPVAAIRQS